MKRITFLTLVLITGLCLHSPPIFAQDQVPAKGDTKDAQASPKGTKGALHASKDVQKGTDQAIAPRSDVSRGSMSNSSTAGAVRSKSTARNTAALSRNAVTQGGQQSSRQQSTALVVQGNQANHYDGRWSSAQSHNDWDRSIDHQWNNQDYRWYDGGWLIIDTSSSPGYNLAGSTGSNVQASLAQQGYYHGPIDGYIGRGTRRAISHYESDNGLQVNGRIDGPLLASLGLQ